MATQTTKDRVLKIRKDMLAELGRPPKSTEIRARLPRSSKVTAQRIRQILAEEDLSYRRRNKAPIDKPIQPRRYEVERILIVNLRRLYRAEMNKPQPRSDVEMAAAGDFGKDRHAAAHFRRYFDGSVKRFGFQALERFAAVFGVQPHELLRPEAHE